MTEAKKSTKASRIVKSFRMFALVVVACMAVSYMATYVARGGTRLNALGDAVYGFAMIPNTLKVAFEELFDDPQVFSLGQGYEPINELDKDYFGLFSYQKIETRQLIFFLQNLRTLDTLYTWHFEPLELGNTVWKYTRPMSPALGTDGSIVFHLNGYGQLVKLDKDSNVEWVNEEVQYHHSTEIDDEGTVWSCAWSFDQPFTTLPTVDQKEIQIKNDLIVQVSPEGDLLLSKSILDIFLENEMYSLLYSTQLTDDPFHLNDVQPVVEDGPYWKKGDVFVSLRNKSTVFLYRPSTNKVLWYQNSPWLAQHDVDILDSTRISVFNNNTVWGYAIGHEDIELNYLVYHRDEAFGRDEFWPYNDVTIYDFATDSVHTPYREFIGNEEIFTSGEGLCEVFSDGRVFVEETYKGKLYIGDQSRTLWKDGIRNGTGSIFRPSWSEVFENDDTFEWLRNQ